MTLIGHALHTLTSDPQEIEKIVSGLGLIIIIIAFTISLIRSLISHSHTR